MIEGSVFVYYGVLLNKSEAYYVAQENREDSIYSVCMANDLKCQLIGHNSYSTDMVVGQEAFWDFGKGIIELDVENKVSISTIEDLDGEANTFTFPLSKEEQERVQQQLIKIGIGGRPRYYVVSSYNSL